MNVYKKILGVAGAALVASSFTLAVSAEDHGPTQGKFYLSPFGHFYAPPDSIELDDDNQLGAGIGLGYGFTERLLGEINYLKSEHDLTAAGREGEEVDIDQYWFDMVYKLSDVDAKSFTPYVVGGYGRMDADRGGLLGRSRDNQVSAGLGFFSDMGNRLSLRGDVRGVYSADEGGLQPFFKLGLTAMLGNLGGAGKAPTDSDGDGVYDSDDRCPNTPAGTAVDAEGCALTGPGDADGDGVNDNVDRCPATPAGVQVDSRGCALDSDGDGVPNYKDKCPGSERGAKVDADGCYVELEKSVTIDLNLEFDTNSADLRSDHYPEIQRVVDFLRQYPTASAVIEGHTDSRGAAAYNQSLSEKRALSVRNYLVNQGGVTAERLTSRGYGETRPKSSNDTAEGRQGNRRVSAVVAGTAKVRQ